MKFDLPKEKSSLIKVIGVGGGGGNAVNHMYDQGIKGVDFIVCNTDQQALDISPIPQKIQLGETLTNGLGAGSNPDTGMNAAIESIEDLKEMLNKGTKMVFITAGMGGGTGTGAAPIIAQACREMDILTVGIVTMPFSFEGKKRRMAAENGIISMRENVDTLLVINNDRLREMYGNLTLDNAFAQADDVLTTASKGIAETITRTGKINVDFNDVNTVMKDSGVAIMGSASAKGENRALKAVSDALASPLLNDNKIEGANYVLLNITYGSSNVLMDEISEVTDYIQDEAGLSADIIWGHGLDESMEDDELNITLIATGFKKVPDTGLQLEEQNRVAARKLVNLEDKVDTQLTKPVETVQEEPSQGLEEPVLKDELSTEQEENLIEETPEIEAPKMRFQLNSEDFDEARTEEPSYQDQSPELEKQELSEPVSEQQEEIQASSTELEAAAEAEELEAEEEDAAQTTFEFTVMNQNAPSTSLSVDDSEANQARVHHLDDEAEAAEQAEGEPFIAKKEEPKQEEIRHELPDASVDAGLSEDERQERAQRRMMNLKNLSMRLKTPSGINDLENEPAFKRRQIDLDETPHSSESQASRYTLSEKEDEDGKKSTEIKPNNRFLHDNVD